VGIEIFELKDEKKKKKKTIKRFNLSKMLHNGREVARVEKMDHEEDPFLTLVPTLT
jgi:hypothetical protein